MLEILNYTFMIRAITIGSLVALIAPLVGIFLVSKRYSLMADTLAHVSLAGVAIGILTGIYPVFTALAVAVIAAVTIQKLSIDKKISGESTLALFLSGGLATATVLIGLGGGFKVDLFAYLFGSITTVTQADIYITIILTVVVIAVMKVLFKDLTHAAVDEDAAKASGVAVDRNNYIFLILTAITITVTIRVIGVLLVSSLMIIPVLTATLIAKSFKQTIVYALLYSLYFVLVGLYISFSFNLAAGGSIVLFALFNFILTKIITKK